MAASTARVSDPDPHMPDHLFHVSTCWREIRDAQTEVDLFGRSFEALGEARASLESLAFHCKGQSSFLTLTDAGRPATDEPVIDRSTALCCAGPIPTRLSDWLGVVVNVDCRPCSQSPALGHDPWTPRRGFN